MLLFDLILNTHFTMQVHQVHRKNTCCRSKFVQPQYHISLMLWFMILLTSMISASTPVSSHICHQHFHVHLKATASVQSTPKLDHPGILVQQIPAYSQGYSESNRHFAQEVACGSRLPHPRSFNLSLCRPCSNSGRYAISNGWVCDWKENDSNVILRWISCYILLFPSD